MGGLRLMGQERVNGRFVKREAPRAGVRWEYEPPRDRKSVV